MAKRSRKVRVPNPRKQAKGRLDAPPTRVHGKKRAYRRRPKHGGRGPGDE